MFTSDQAEKTRLALAGSGWREVIKPAIEQRKQVAQNLAFLLPSERPEPYSKIDDHTATAILRGEVKALEWVLAVFYNEVKIYDFNRRKDEESVGPNGAMAGIGQPGTQP